MTLKVLDREAIKIEQQDGQNQMLNSLSLAGHCLKIVFSILQRKSHKPEATNISAPILKLPY